MHALDHSCVLYFVPSTDELIIQCRDFYRGSFFRSSQRAHPYSIYGPQSQNPSDLLPAFRVWSSTAITLRVTRINACPDFVFTIKDFPILITDDIFEMICAIWQDDNTKALIDIIAEVSPEDTRAGANLHPNISGFRQGHTSGYQNPRQRPATPTSTSMLLVAKSTTTRSGYTCATVTTSQSAFMQFRKAKERRYSFLLS